MKYGIYSGDIGNGQFTVIGTPEPCMGLYLTNYEGVWAIEEEEWTDSEDHDHKESSVLELPREYLL